jgi:hypothetical protein
MESRWKPGEGGSPRKVGIDPLAGEAEGLQRGGCMMQGANAPYSVLPPETGSRLVATFGEVPGRRLQDTAPVMATLFKPRWIASA